MAVDQIVVRINVSSAYRRQLGQKMKVCMAQGKEFSVAIDGNKFAIRRDK